MGLLLEDVAASVEEVSEQVTSVEEEVVIHRVQPRDKLALTHNHFE